MDSEGRTLLEVSEEGGLRLNNPATGLPRMEYGEFAVPEGLGPRESTNPHFGLWVFDMQGRRVAGLASMEFVENPVDGEPNHGYGAVLAFSKSEIPAVELTASGDCDGELILKSGTAQYPGNWAVRLHGKDGDGGLELRQMMAIRQRDGSVEEVHGPGIRLGSVEF